MGSKSNVVSAKFNLLGAAFILSILCSFSTQAVDGKKCFGDQDKCDQGCLANKDTPCLERCFVVYQNCLEGKSDAPSPQAAMTQSAGEGASKDTVVSESRDASLAYIGTSNFIVGRLGSECLAKLGRSDSPQQFVAAWHNRNAKYVNAAAKYMQKRLEEAEASGGTGMRDDVFLAVTLKSRASGEAAIRGWFEKGSREEVCKRAVSLVESGAFDISPKAPMFGELESLASWAQE